MHIAIDVRSLMEGRHSGVEEYTTQIIRALSRVAPRHTYHLFYNSAREVTLPKFSGNVVEHPFRYPNTLFNTAQWLTAHPRWDNLVRPPRGRRRKMDVFFLPNPRLMPLSPETPLVVVAHDLSFERFPEFLNLRRRAWHAMMRPRLLMQNADHVIAVSEHTKHDLLALYDIPAEKVSVIHSGITEGVEGSGALDIHRVRERYHLPERFLLYVGRLEPRKNIPSIIRAFSAVADRIPHHLVIAGEAGWRARGIHQAIAASPHRERVQLIGFVNEADKMALYAAADLFVYPSFYEGFGFPPLESLAAGTPVITSFNSALPEVVGKWATLVDPYNTAQLAAVIRELLGSPKRVSLQVQQEIRQTYSWDTAARQTIKILESVV